MTLFDEFDEDDDRPLPNPVNPNAERPTGRTHPDTSREAARDNTVKFATERGKVLDAVAAVGMRGLTAAEVNDACKLTSRNQTAIALQELRKLGWLERVTPEVRGPYDDEVVKKDGYIARRTSEKGQGVVHVLTSRGRMDYSRREQRRRDGAEG